MTNDEVESAWRTLRAAAERSLAASGACSTRSMEQEAAAREDRLDRLIALLIEEADAFVAAIDADFGGRSRHETMLADILATLGSARVARRSVRAWMRPERVAPGPFFRPGVAWIEPRPLGVVGIIAPWNYPVNLALGPLVGVLAAGNRALIKPSEATPRTAALIGRAVRDRFSAEEVAVVEGGLAVAEAMSCLPLDHLVFTGSTGTGRLVARAAAANLVPLTLELGGKSPVLVHPDYPAARAAERVLVGKLFNAGQTCIAPDYVLLPAGREEVFLDAFRDIARRRVSGLPDSPDYTAMASERGLYRMLALLDDARSRGARVERVGGATPPGSRKLAPHIIFGAPEDALVLREEIFGPLLPIVSYPADDLASALAFVQARPRPLAFYCFDPDTRRAARTLDGVVSGGAAINDTVIHFAQENLPFGGVGPSGMGAYHGRAGFDTFSHRRGVMSASAASPARRLLAPPYGAPLNAAIRALRGRWGGWVQG